LKAWRNRVVASRGFQTLASRTPLLRRIARNEGEALMDLVSGFVQSQVLLAVVELELLPRLMDHDRSAADLAAGTGLSPDRMTALCDAAAALGLMTRGRDARYGLSQRGAALTGVPGLMQMIRHHRVLYGDLADPVSVLRGDRETDLARFWPYVFGAAEGDVARDTARTYSQLMADSQTLVAEETLRTINLRGVRRLLDVGGGTGAFLTAALTATPGLTGVLFDLPAVVPEAESRFAAAGLAERVTIRAGSFREGPLPGGADAISLVRVLYDHGDDTVAALLAAAHAALPPGGRLIVSEPMTGGDRPSRSGDVYFAFYCMAMQTGRARSGAEIAGLMREAGFASPRQHRSFRPFLTSVVSAVRPG
jgi:demethylspheroidene O-methyltransferase